MFGSFLWYRAALALTVIAIVPSPQLIAGEVNYYPDDTELVVRVNLKQILSSEMVKAQPDALGELKEVLGQFAGIQAVQKYLKEAGLDAFRDLHGITYVYTGSTDPRVSFLMLKGEFNVEKLTELARAGGAAIRISKLVNHSVFVITPRGEKSIYAALVNPSMLVAATTEDSLGAALARADGSKKSALKNEMNKLLSSFDDQQSIAFVSSGNAVSRLLTGTAIPNAENAIAFLQTLEVFSGSITLGKGVQFQLAFNADSEETAKKLTESANGALRILLTLVQQSAEKDGKYQAVVPAVKAMHFSSQGARILFSGEVSLDTVETLMKNFPVDRLTKDKK